MEGYTFSTHAAEDERQTKDITGLIPGTNVVNHKEQGIIHDGHCSFQSYLIADEWINGGDIEHCKEVSRLFRKLEKNKVLTTTIFGKNISRPSELNLY